MSKKFNSTQDARERAKQEIISILTERLHFPDARFISYSDLAKRITAIKVEAYSKELIEILDQINREYYEKGKRMLTVLVINKKTLMPGKGFFKLAKELHSDYINKENKYIFDKELDVLLSDQV